ncbi:ATP-dependent helicase [Fodinisporobacter ferrooxydans]|uniref:ATP-dependent helicase n=1 Tax=Fodinisporobacter ferrooxydans TaxID=2901836 RepID=A0ABY4CLX3_9BACL|nr:ATP-dependent helicase [Alicyclobacillaceae bacterium MYW30-H2]
MFPAETKCSFTVADEDQLIYEWNDARFEYLLQFVQKQNAKILQMFENYRCPQEVLNAANRLIRLNLHRLADKRDLNANKLSSGQAIFLDAFETPEEEVNKIVAKIQELDAFEETCIIARNRFVLQPFAEYLVALGIPFHQAATDERFASREVKVLTYLLQAVFNEQDKLHLNLVCDLLGIDVEEVILNSGNGTLCMSFIRMLGDKKPNLARILGQFINNKVRFEFYMERILQEISGIALDEETDENRLIFDDFKQLKSILANYKREREDEERNLGDFLGYLALSPKANSKQIGVSLLTGHAAKGLEYDYVFLVSLNQGIFPDYRAVKDGRQLEEERRNCFVAITRTKRNLFISYTKLKQTRFGLKTHEPSQFIREMDLIDDEGALLTTSHHV